MYGKGALMNEWGVLLTLTGVWGWIGCMLIFIFRAFPSRDLFNGKEAFKWGGGSLLCFFIWITGMMVI